VRLLGARAPAVADVVEQEGRAAQRGRLRGEGGGRLPGHLVRGAPGPRGEDGPFVKVAGDRPDTFRNGPGVVAGGGQAPGAQPVIGRTERAGAGHQLARGPAGPGEWPGPALDHGDEPGPG